VLKDPIVGPKDLNVADVAGTRNAIARLSATLGLDDMHPSWHAGDKICRTNS
jgi:hypothetical protein